MTDVVASVIASSNEEMICASRERTDGADIIELRVDAVRQPDPARLQAEVSKPTIFTCRCKTEGGFFEGSESERLGLLKRAMELEFDFVDIEMSSATPELLADRGSTKIIVSHHRFDCCPDDLEGLVNDCLRTGPDLVKLAVRASSLADAFTLADAGRAARARGVGFIPIALGPSGAAARVLATRLQADLAYAAARGLPPAGPGQVDLETLLEMYRFRSLGSQTRIFGLLGYPATGSLSPLMHNGFFARTGLDAVYLPFEEAQLDSFAAAARRLGISGLSVTRPHKEAIMDFLDEIDPGARRIGAVNTIAVRDGKWIGFNTDVDGVVGPVGNRLDIRGSLAVILGAGGAARAAAFALAGCGARVVVLARRLEQARALATAVGGRAGELEEVDGFGWDILVNATPVGERLPAPVADVRPGSVVLDMVYEPERTVLLETARRAGAQAVPGLEMLATQAVRQAEIWTGSRPTVAELERSGRGELDRRARAKYQ